MIKIKAKTLPDSTSVEVQIPVEYDELVYVTQAMGEEDPSHKDELFYSIDFVPRNADFESGVVVSSGLPGELSTLTCSPEMSSI